MKSFTIGMFFLKYILSLFVVLYFKQPLASELELVELAPSSKEINEWTIGETLTTFVPAVFGSLRTSVTR
jgi:hypothetical protein